MNTNGNTAASEEGTRQAPHFYEGLCSDGGIRQHRRYFSYRTEEGLVVGSATNVLFTINRPARSVWPYFKDFNLWQNADHHYYSGVVGDLEGRTFRLTVGSNVNDPDRLWSEYRVVRVVPEYVIALSQVPRAQEFPGVGHSEGIGGFMVFMLSEHGGETVVTILMHHDQLTKGKTEEEALEFWRKLAPDSFRKWQDVFVPTLEKLVCEAG